MNKNTYNITVKLCRILYPNINVVEYLNPYFKLFNRMEKNNGIIYTVKFFKQGRLHCTRYMCGNPLLFNKIKLGIDPDGWPIVFGFLKNLNNGSLEERKFMLTILSLTRSIILNNKEKQKLIPDYNSITKPSEMKKIIPSGFIKEFVNKFNLNCELPIFDKKEIYLSNKAGPIGKTTLSALSTICSLPYYTIQNLYKLTNEEGINYFNQSYKFAWDMKNSNINNITGKLSFIYDPECKLRIVAIVDYYTQLFLKPIHEKIMKKLQNLPQDRTYTQDPYNKWNDDLNQYWSLDLSSATDRFPIKLQRRLLEHVFSKNLSEGWFGILSDRKFKTPEGHLVSYETGQPMGAYSSWAAFTLTHHLVVHWCAYLSGINNFKDYIILGDDIVIKNDKVARLYKIWIKNLGVDLSEAKTHVSVDTYEFAKRWICKGKEITGVPISGIINNINNPFIVMVNLYDFYKIKRNYLSSSLNLTKIVSKLYKGLNRKLSTKYSNSRFNMKISIFHKSLDHCFGYSTIDSLRELISNNLNNDLVMIPNDNLIHSLLNDIIGLGIGKTVKNSMVKLNTLVESIISNRNYLNEDEINNLRYYPVFTGINNYLNNYKDQVSNWQVNSVNFRQRSKELLMLNIDNVFNKERNKTLELLNTGKIFKLGFDEINSTDEIIYGSSIGESTYSYSSDLTNHISNNYSMTFNKLNEINNGTYKVEELRSSKSIYDSYANFFN